jgi:hypothetical protein
MSLQAAVPLLIADLRHIDTQQRVDLARAAVQPLVEHGDDLQYGGKHCRAAFAAVARALAAGAYQPGGITFAGQLWCAAHRPFGAALEWPCADCLASAAPAGAGTAVDPVLTISVAGGRL